MKRLDLIFSEKELPSVLEIIDSSGATGYSVIKHVTGKGPHNIVSEDMEFTGLGANVHMIIFCEQSVLEKSKEGINAILEYYGGVAYTSEADVL
mgnify:CR=1 FL=1